MNNPHIGINQTKLIDLLSKYLNAKLNGKDLLAENALTEYRDQCRYASSTDKVITTERGKETSAQVIVNMFSVWYRKMGFSGCSSHWVRIR